MVFSNQEKAVIENDFIEKQWSAYFKVRNFCGFVFFGPFRKSFFREYFEILIPKSFFTQNIGEKISFLKILTFLLLLLLTKELKEEQGETNFLRL